MLIDDDATFGASTCMAMPLPRSALTTNASRMVSRPTRAVVVSNVVAYWDAIALSRNLGGAMEHRGVIEQAKGVLMGAHHVSADDAFNRCDNAPKTENRKLRDIGLDVVADTQPVAGY